MDSSPETMRLIESIEFKMRHQENIYGSPENPTKEGLLLLARSGSEVWNTWFSKGDKNHHIDFSDHDFRSEDIDFSCFIFKNRKNSTHEVKFTRSKFGKISFENSLFELRADFSSSEFFENSSFENSKFEKTSSFRGITSHSSISFEGAQFDQFANFSNSIFLHFTDFTNSIFADIASFNECKFGKCEDSEFSMIIFDNSRFMDSIHFTDSEFRAGSSFRVRNIEASGKHEYFLMNANFSGCIFAGATDFENRKFIGTTSFGASQNGENARPTIFHRAPKFHGCKFHQDTSFDGAEFKAPPTLEAARAYRTLKLAMEQLKATREEQRFFRLEMEAEHPDLPKGKRWISTLYSLFSDYGFSLWRPAAWLLALSLAFGTGYGALANACAGNAGCIDIKAATDADAVSGPDRTSAVIKYTLGSVSPVPGLDKMQTELRAPLFGHQGWISIAALVLEILHKITTLVMTFLFALALRNLFKMKS